MGLSVNYSISSKCARKSYVTFSIIFVLYRSGIQIHIPTEGAISFLLHRDKIVDHTTLYQKRIFLYRIEIHIIRHDLLPLHQNMITFCLKIEVSKKLLRTTQYVKRFSFESGSFLLRCDDGPLIGLD